MRIRDRVTLVKDGKQVNKWVNYSITFLHKPRVFHRQGKNGFWYTRKEKLKFRIGHNGKRFADNVDYHKLAKRYPKVFKDIYREIDMCYNKKYAKMMLINKAKEVIRGRKRVSVYEVAHSIESLLSKNTIISYLKEMAKRGFQGRRGFVYLLETDMGAGNGRERSVFVRYQDPLRVVYAKGERNYVRVPYPKNHEEIKRRRLQALDCRKV